MTHYIPPEGWAITVEAPVNASREVATFTVAQQNADEGEDDDIWDLVICWGVTSLEEGWDYARKVIEEGL